MTLFCKPCGKEVEYLTAPAGPHLKATCKECGGYIKFLPTVPIDQFKIPFGQYRGELILKVAEKDKQYLEWLGSQEEIKESLRNRITEAISLAGRIQKLL